MLVADRMHRDVITVDREASLRRARRVMENHRIRHLPVVEGRRLVGIVTDRDLRQASPSTVSSLTTREREEFLDYVRVSQVMTRRIITIAPGATIHEAADLMRRYRVGCLPVVEDRQVVGILTTSDLIALLAEILGPTAEEQLVVVDVSDDPLRLEALARIAALHHARLTTLLNAAGMAGGPGRAFLRVQGDRGVLCAALVAAGFQVIFRPAPRVEDELILEHLGRS
jgi:acetoin utilization protein AcuB